MAERTGSSKRRLISLAGGTLWLVVVGAAFAIASLVWMRTPGAMITLAGVVLAAALLTVNSIRAIRSAARLEPARLPPRTTEERRIVRRFGVVVGAEVLVIMAVNGVCAAYQRFVLMAPLDLLIVGLHFIPLAGIFRIPRYYATGVLLSVVPLVTLLLVPEAAFVGRAPAWFAVPSLVSSGVVWVTAMGNLNDVFRRLREERVVVITP